MNCRSRRQNPNLAWIALPLLVAATVGFRIALRPTGGWRVRSRWTNRVESRSAQSIEGKSAQVAGLKVTYWKPDASQTAPYPLVIFSHGFHGSSTQSKFLMKDLAAHGYLVVAPDHQDAGFGGKPEESFAKAETWTDARYRGRGEDIRNLIAGLKADSTWNSEIDWTKVALAGHSLGGYTVLGLAGAWKSWKMPGIKAVLALSPYCSPLISKGTLGAISVPVMYQGGTRDFGITPYVKRSGGAYDQTPAPAYFVEFRGAGHLAWTDLNPNFQPEISAYSVAFLDKYVKGIRNTDLTTKSADVSVLRSK